MLHLPRTPKVELCSSLKLTDGTTLLFFPTQREQANPSEESKYLNSANNYLSKELTQTKTPTHTHVLVHAQHVTANLTLRNQREKKKKKSVDLSYGTY